ncbi:MAG: RNA polymerase sigma-70 factor [Ferruginibacter sp.]|nr:RNA polymerase sigma-70 factor [Ferruginibacter sp.]
MDYRLLPDDGLLKLLKYSDEAALKEIYLRYWKNIYFSAIKKVGIKNIAEELVQNVFVSLWTNRETANIRQLQNYLNTAIKYQVINFLKSKILREKYTLQSSMFVAQEEDSCESILLTHELSGAIDKATKKLPEKSRQIFQLSRMENHSIKDIARNLHISEKTVEYHITRSLKIMRIYLKDFIAVNLVFFIFPFG